MIIDSDWLAEKINDINTQGYTTISNFLSDQELGEIETALNPHLGHFQGRNNFEGERTERVYTLVGRGQSFERVAQNQQMMSLCEAFLQPNYLLTACQAIRISPGETPQPFHTDDSFYAIARPRPMVSLSMIAAIDDFTTDNGGTQLIPGSHLWDDNRVANESGLLGKNGTPGLEQQAVTVEMKAGSCVVFAGTLLHRGGANRSNGSRCAVTFQYCQPWARTQENFFLAIPPEKVRQMSPQLQSLLGYSIHPPFMGQLSASHPLKALEPDFVAPVMR